MPSTPIKTREIKMRSQLPECLLRKTLPEIKEDVFQGRLLTALKKAVHRQGDELLAIAYVDEAHFNHAGYELLTLSLTFQARNTKQAYKEEWVLQFSNNGPGQRLSGAALPYWIYPHDPALPLLSNMLDDPNVLKGLHWEKITEAFLPDDEDISLQRLLYNPNRRVTYLITSEKTRQQFILKMVKQEDFEPFYKIAKALKESDIASKLILPNLLAFSREAGLFLYHYIPGLQIKKLEKQKTPAFTNRLFEEVVEILKTVHQMPLSTLADWQPEAQENEHLESLWNALSRSPRPIQQAGAKVIRPLVNHLMNTFNQQKPPYPFMIHNSFSEKHILSRGEGKQFGILDWDSAVRGPREKDIGQFLSNFIEQPEACRRFIALYVSKTGFAVDEDLVNHFIVCRLLLRLMRKGLKRHDPGEDYLDELKTLSAKLDIQSGK